MRKITLIHLWVDYYFQEAGNSSPHLGHLAILHCTEDAQPEQAKALPYVMSKVKPHLGQCSKCFDFPLTLIRALQVKRVTRVLKAFLKIKIKIKI